MHTEIRSTRRRAPRRGFAALVSFLLLFAFALGQGSIAAQAKNPKKAAAEEAASSGEAAASEAPAAEAPAAEAPAAEAPAADVPAVDDTAADAADDTSGAAAAPAARQARAQKPAKADRSGAVAAPAAAQQLDGGDIDVDFVAAGPFTYDHSTGLGTNPPFGYNSRTISKNNGVVESLESGDFACGDLVTFFTQITVDDGAAGSGTVVLNYTFGNETTGQPGLGFDNVVSAASNIPDSGNVGNVADNVVTLSNVFTETQGYDQVHATVTTTNLAPGEVAIVRIIAHLFCIPGETPTGNILNAIQSGTADGDTISIGQQTVPMKTTGFVAEPDILVEKECPANGLVGEELHYTIFVTNTGNDDLEDLVVMDTVDGHAAEQVTAPTDLAVGDSLVLDFAYMVQAGDPSPLSNSVTATASGVLSEVEVSGTADCETELLHPAINVAKQCPEGVFLVGDEIHYTITVTNNGDEDLEDVSVMDTVDGHAAVAVPGAPTTLAAGEFAVLDFFYTVQAGDPSPLPNSVTASGTGVTSGVDVFDFAECSNTIVHPSIDVTKSCTPLAHVGETVTYEITVTNNGDEALTDVTVVDTILGDLSASFADDLAVGASETRSFDHVVTESDPDPLVNEVTATGTGAQSEEVVDDTATCVTDVIHPGIVIVKSVDEDVVPVGTTVTFTYVVTNTGDTTLFDVTVDDNVLGHIGDIPVLEPGQSVTLTKDFVVGDDPVTNVATAEGEDVLGRSVSSSDAVTVSPIAGENPPPPTPFTGSDAGRLGLLAIVLLGIGATLVAVTRRRRTEDGSA